MNHIWKYGIQTPDKGTAVGLQSGQNYSEVKQIYNVMVTGKHANIQVQINTFS